MAQLAKTLVAKPHDSGSVLGPEPAWQIRHSSEMPYLPSYQTVETVEPQGSRNFPWSLRLGEAQGTSQGGEPVS